MYILGVDVSISHLIKLIRLDVKPAEEGMLSAKSLSEEPVRVTRRNGPFLLQRANNGCPMDRNNMHIVKYKRAFQT